MSKLQNKHTFEGNHRSEVSKKVKSNAIYFVQPTHVHLDNQLMSTWTTELSNIQPIVSPKDPPKETWPLATETRHY